MLRGDNVEKKMVKGVRDKEVGKEMVRNRNKMLRV